MKELRGDMNRVVKLEMNNCSGQSRRKTQFKNLRDKYLKHRKYEENASTISKIKDGRNTYFYTRHIMMYVPQSSTEINFIEFQNYKTRKKQNNEILSQNNYYYQKIAHDWYLKKGYP